MQVFHSFRSMIINLCLFSLTLLLAISPLYFGHSALAQLPDEYAVTQVAQMIAQVTPYSPSDQNEQAIIDAYLATANRTSSTSVTTVTRLVTTDSYALLDWVYSEMGGQVVLIHTASGWQVLRGTGGVLGVQTMIQFGVPADVAQQLQSLYQQKYQ